MFGWFRTASVHLVTAEASVSDILVLRARLLQPLFFLKVLWPHACSRLGPYPRGLSEGREGVGLREGVGGRLGKRGGLTAKVLPCPRLCEQGQLKGTGNPLYDLSH